MDRLGPIVVLAVAVGVAQPAPADADDITVWAARAIATVLAETGPEFERTTGHTLRISSDLSSGFERRANAGEPFDVVIMGSAGVDAFIKSGKVRAETRTDIATSGIGVAVRAGARKPAIGTVEAFTRALLEAKSIAYLKVGSGLYLDGLLERLGIAKALEPKVTRPDSDIVSELVAKGEVELGMVVITQILTTHGVELVGPLPPEIQSHVTFAGAVSKDAKAPRAARQLMTFLAGPTAHPVIRAQGMQPAR